MTHVFISYSRRDSVYMRQLTEQLLSRGFNVWMDESVDYGEDWWRAISRAIREASAVVVIMTPESDKSRWVQREITLADELGKPTFPLLLEGDVLSSEHWTIFVRTQYIDVRDGTIPLDDFFTGLGNHAPRRTGRGARVTDKSTSGLPDVSETLPAPFAWCEIPNGFVILTDARSYGGTTGGKYSVDAFYMARYPVTNAQYQKFVDAKNGYSETQWWDFSPEAQIWREKHPNPMNTGFAGDDLPRTNVTWYEAMAFCRWLTAQVNAKSEGALQITLPTEQQWQRAAVGDLYIAYPWGTNFDRRMCNADESGIGKPTPVTRYLNGASPYDVVDMIGNVWEWCLTDWETGSANVQSDNPRSVRGSSWFDTGKAIRATTRDGFNAAHASNFLGFRVVCVVGE